MLSLSPSDTSLCVPDAALMRRFAQEASPEAFQELVARYHGLVHGTARRILQSDDAARDIVQEVFVRLAREIRRIRPATLAAWLHRTARNKAINLQRGEVRRRLREQSTSEHLHTMAADIPDQWADALEHLDAALDHLSLTERRCVFDRYLLDRPLREIAAAAGKSEDAARMTIHRALGKMSSFFRRKGVALSVTGLASGLTAEFSRAAASLPGPAAAALAAGVITKAAPSAASSSLTLISSLFMTKTTAILSAAALLFILAMGGGWLANRTPSPAPSRNPAPTNITSTKPAPSPALPSNNTTAKPAASSPSQIEEVIAKLEALRAKRAAITGRIPRDSDILPDPKVVESVYKDIEALEPEVHAVLTTLDAASLPDAVAAALKLKDPAKGVLLGQLFTRWGMLDPARAVAEANRLPANLQDTGLTSAARGWARLDPRAALAAAAELNPDNDERRTRFVREVITGCMQTDAAAAVKALAELPVDDQRHAAKAFDDLLRFPSQRPAATAEIAKLTDDALRADIAGAITEDWAKFDGPAAAAWFDALAWKNPNAGLKAASELAGEWGSNPGRMEAALDWLWPKVPFLMRPEILEDLVAKRWARMDRAAAEAWLAKQSIPTAAVPDWDRHTRR